MANVNNPHGLRPLMRTLAGGFPQTFGYSKAAAYGFAIYKWDPVTLLAGVLNGPASGITPGTTRLLGVVMGAAQANPVPPASGWWAASVAATLLVMDDPEAMYEVQGDGSGGGANVISAATVGFNANLVAAAGAGVTRDNSGEQLAESTIAVTSTLDVNIHSLLNVPDNAYGVNARVEIKINKHLKNPEVTQT